MLDAEAVHQPTRHIACLQVTKHQIGFTVPIQVSLVEVSDNGARGWRIVQGECSRKPRGDQFVWAFGDMTIRRNGEAARSVLLITPRGLLPGDESARAIPGPARATPISATAHARLTRQRLGQQRMQLMTVLIETDID